MRYIWIGGILVFFALGTWQVSRMMWKLNLISEYEKNSNSSAISLDHAIDNPTPHKRVLVTGTLGDKTMQIRGNTIGTITSGDHTVLMSLGRSLYPQPSEQATLVGLVTPIDAATMNAPERNVWAGVNPAQISESWGVNLPADFYLRVLKATPDLGFRYHRPEAPYRNAHLSYVLTWYGLGLVWFVMGLIYRRKKRMQ